jgi:transposase, mutator family
LNILTSAIIKRKQPSRNDTKLIENGEFTEYFQYTPAIRKLIYTTNTVEGYHRQVRKVTKNKGVFPSDTALEKLVYLAYRDIREKWTMPLSQLLELRHEVAYFLFQIFLFPS